MAAWAPAAPAKLFLHDVVQLLQCCRLHLFEVGDPHHQIQTHLLRELAQDLGRLLRLQIGEHYGLDLRVFVLDDAGHLTGIHPLERIEAAGTGTKNDLVHQVARLVLAKRGYQCLAHEIFAADTYVGVLLDIVDELTVHRRYPIVAEIRHGCHRHTEPLYLLGFEMAEDLGGILFVKAQHQYRRHLHTGHLIQQLTLAIGDIVAGYLVFTFFRHLWLPTL